MRGCARRSASGRLNSSGSGTSRGWPSPVYVTLETARRGGGKCWGDEEVANRIPRAVLFSAEHEPYADRDAGALGRWGASRRRPPREADAQLSNVRVEHDLYVLKKTN